MRKLLIGITVLVVVLGCFHSVQLSNGLIKSVLDQVHEDALPAKAVSQQVMNYLNSPGWEFPELEGFTEKELFHLHDVKIAIQFSMLSFILLIIIWIFCFKYYGISPKELYYASGFLTGIPLLFGVVPFDLLFSGFHYLFFASGTWIFPSSDLLIQTYPFAFFQILAFHIGLRIVISGILLGVIAYSIIKLK